MIARWRLALILCLSLGGRAQAGGYLGFGVALRAHVLVPGAGAYFADLGGYGYRGVFPVSMAAHGFAGFPVLAWLDAGASLRYLSSPVAATPSGLTLSLDELELGGFVRAHQPRGRWDLGARVEAGVARPWLRLRRTSTGRAAAYAALTLDSFYWVSPRWGLEFHLDYTVVDAEHAFAPYLAHPLGGVGGGLMASHRF